MYCQFYGFREKPFSLLPDPDFLFLSQKHETALNLLELGILNQSGFCIISGEVGAGKTTLVRELLNRLDKRVRVGLISNTHSTFSDLLGWILAAYELECESSEAVFQHRRFTDFTIEQYASGKHTLLIIDEAQNLSLSALEQLRMLSNINSEKDLVLQIILVGQNELRTKLQQPELKQFAQRVAIDYHLAALDLKETTEYIRHRVTKSGGPQQLFDDAACRLVSEYSGGIPRLINRICDLSLVYGFSESKKIIDADLIKAVTEGQKIEQLTKTPEESPAGKRPAVALPKPDSLLGKLAIRHKDTAETIRKSARKSGSTFKKNKKKTTGTTIIGNTIEVQPAEKNAVEKTVQPIDKRTKVHRKHKANSTIYAAAENASVEKIQAEYIATEKRSVAGTLIEKSKTDIAFAAKINAETLTSKKEATEKEAKEKAATALAEASMAAAKLAESEKLAAEKDDIKFSSAAEQATAFIVNRKQTADKLVVEKARIEKQVLKEAAAAKAAAEKALAERIAAEKAAAETAVAADAAAKKATANRIAVEKATASMVSDSEAAAERALARKSDAARIVSEKTVAHRAAIEKASTNTELAKKASAERAAANSAAREKATAAEQAEKKAAASRAATEKALAEKKAADTISKEKKSLEKVALAKVAVSIAASAQQAADRAIAARIAAQREASEKEAAAITAARKAAEASALAEKAAAESHTHIDRSDLYPERKPGIDSRSVNHLQPGEIQPKLPLVQTKLLRSKRHRRARTILAFSVVSAILAASTWLITRPEDRSFIANLSVIVGQSFSNPGQITEAAALEPVVQKSDFK